MDSTQHRIGSIVSRLHVMQAIDAVKAEFTLKSIEHMHPDDALKLPRLNFESIANEYEKETQ
jgi:hypothetical protein